MRQILLLLILTCSFDNSQAQHFTLLSSGGEFATSNGLFLNYSIGEACIQYTQNGSIWVTEGFQQPGQVDVMVSNADLEQALNWKIYPNPAADAIYLKGLAMTECDALQIVNFFGQRLLNLRVNEDEMAIDIHHLAPGLYNITLCCDGGATYNHAFIKI